MVTNAAGVNPEQNGYDTQYQCLGIYCANIYLPYCTDPMLAQQLQAMTTAGMSWESGFISPNGMISIAGDSRMGIELDRNGVVKTPSKGVTWGAFDLGSQNTGSTLFATYASRIANQGIGVDSNAVATSGAVDANSAYDLNSSSAWNIGSQKIGVDYVEMGIAEENDALIQQGISIINWGLAKQSADGSFGTTSSPFYATACFVEAAARAAHDLQQYDPQTYTPTTDYQSWASSTLASCVSACNWLTSPATTKHYSNGISAMTSHEWFVAAALAETGAYTGNTVFQADADPYATTAINLQTSSGEDPESGAADVNYQAIGLNAAMHYASACDSAALMAETLNAADNGLVWEGQYISPAGVISGTSSPALRPIQRALALGSTLPHAAYFQVLGYRLGGPPTE